VGGWISTSQPDATLNVPCNLQCFSTVAISGDTIVAGGEFNFAYEGTLYIYVKPAGGWSGTLDPTATLIASNGRPGDSLGWSEAISGGTVVAGAVGANQASGALYVFVKPATGWTDAIETAELTAPNTYNLGLVSPPLSTALWQIVFHLPQILALDRVEEKRT